MSHCLLHKLTPEYLADEAALIPDELRHITEFVLSNLIIARALGNQFWSREICTGGNRETDFFQTRLEVKTIQLADLIWRLRDKPGFAHALHKNGNSSFESTYFELVAADMINSSCNQIEFVRPTGVKGQDYDLRAYNFWGLTEVAAEFKNRRSNFHSPSTLINFLQSIRKQLPKAGKGVIFCKIANRGHFGTQNDITNVISQWLRSGTTRVYAVVLCWDEMENEQLSSKFIYSVINAKGISNHTLEKRNVNEISFLKDIGYELPDNSLLKINKIYHLGKDETISLGTWNSKSANWWTPRFM